MQYILTNLNAFLTIIAIGFSLYLYHTNISENNNLSEKNNSPIQLISQLKGYFSINPLLAMCLVVSMFSFVGLPPLMGFFGKQMVLTSALDNNNTILVIVAILTSVIGAVYYLSVIKTIYFDKSDYKKSYIFVQVSLSNYLSISLAILTLIISLFILMPNEPLNLCSLLASSLSETINYDFNQIDLYKFFNETLLLDYTIKYKYYYNILLNSLNNILAGLYIILISMSENIMSINSILQHKPELDTNHKNKQEQEIITINVCYTTKDIDGNDFRVIYDNNETAGTRLTFLYLNSPRYRPIPETININGQQYNGLRFYSSNISTPNPGRGLYNPSFRFTQHEMHDGI
jgi:NADH-ubiquinone oxidoreductase chain 2